MWIAKSKYNGTTYGKPYNSIYNCQAYIDKELKEESNKHRKLRALKIFKEKYKREPLKNMDSNFTKYMEDKFKLFAIEINLSNGILCWNIEQQRFCDGMDF